MQCGGLRKEFFVHSDDSGTLATVLENAGKTSLSGQTFLFERIDHLVFVNGNHFVRVRTIRNRIHVNAFWSSVPALRPQAIEESHLLGRLLPSAVMAIKEPLRCQVDGALGYIIAFTRRDELPNGEDERFRRCGLV